MRTADLFRRLIRDTRLAERDRFPTSTIDPAFYYLSAGGEQDGLKKDVGGIRRMEIRAKDGEKDRRERRRRGMAKIEK